MTDQMNEKLSKVKKKKWKEKSFTSEDLGSLHRLKWNFLKIVKKDCNGSFSGKNDTSWSDFLRI